VISPHRSPAPLLRTAALALFVNLFILTLGVCQQSPSEHRMLDNNDAVSKHPQGIFVPVHLHIRGLGADVQKSPEPNPSEVPAQEWAGFEAARLSTERSRVDFNCQNGAALPEQTTDQLGRDHAIFLMVPLSSDGFSILHRLDEGVEGFSRAAWSGPMDIPWRRALRTAAIGGALLMLDEDTLQPWFRKNLGEHGWLGGFANSLGELGGRYSLVALGGLYARGGPKGREAARLALAAVFDASVTTGLSKFAFGRSRPDGYDEHGDWKPFSGNNSMPSGHSSVAFAMATVLADRYPRHKLLYYGLATSVALARVQSDRHFTSDVFVGGAIGVYSARRVLQNKQRILSWRF